MAIRMVSGNEAVAFAALSAGVKVVSGYPGTPSSEVIVNLLKMSLPGTHVEWSMNEKVAVEVAAAAAWAGKRALCTMKMSGLNVAYDSLCGIAYSGVNGGLVIYVCDDPGVTTGMVEQDSRGFAMMSDMVILEPGNVQETYAMIQYAFELSEAIAGPVFVRSVTNVSQSHAAVDIQERALPCEDAPSFELDITKYTKAGAAICMQQHRDAIGRLAKAAGLIRAKKLHELTLSPGKGGLGIITASIAKCYVDEALEIAKGLGAKIDACSLLKTACTIPYPDEEIDAMLNHCGTLVILEENEPYLERQVYVRAHTIRSVAKIIGKQDGTLSRIGAYTAATAAKAICAACGVPFPQDLETFGATEAASALPRPIGVCAGCPHRGTYMAINAAVRKAGYKKSDVIVTGDIGCTILGMSPPFNCLWTEISMGASIPFAQGFRYSGMDKPIIATIGDSTFQHAGIPGLINAVQQNIDLTVIIMDNGWTAMTGMQVNPNTADTFQPDGCRRIDLTGIVKGLGVEPAVVDPYDQNAMTAAIGACLAEKGIHVIVARRECAIQTNRRKIKHNAMRVDPAKCIFCKTCIRVTGCPALSAGDKIVEMDSAVCNGCSLCSQVCPKQAIIKEEVR